MHLFLILVSLFFPLYKDRYKFECFYHKILAFKHKSKFSKNLAILKKKKKSSEILELIDAQKCYHYEHISPVNPSNKLYLLQIMRLSYETKNII
ncbi:hypothetical protein DLK00_02575 [Haemophilus influenzae]|nr:hypothetical protein DLK00_02575 [Haemophilus influenzae]